MLGPAQKALIHIYKDAAGLFDVEYRAILQQCAGVESCADRRFSQAAFDQVMAHIEGVLFRRVRQGLVASPLGRSKRILRETHWRDKCPPPGQANIRQLCTIKDRWGALLKQLPHECRTLDYLLGIAAKSSGHDVPDLETISESAAAHLLDALDDRLGQFVPRPQEQRIPF